MKTNDPNPLRVLRKSKGWTIEELSNRSGIPMSTLSRVERGLQEPSTGTLVKLARALDLDDLAKLADQWTR
jgi:transcriptional regulator with XRE-family HTH domain